MQSFVTEHADKITGILGCFDRLIFKGHLPISFAQGLENFLARHDVLLKNFKDFAPAQAQLLKECPAAANQVGRPYKRRDIFGKPPELNSEAAGVTNRGRNR